MNSYSDFQNKFFEKISLSTVGLIGTSIVLSTMFLTALLYRGPSGQIFNPINHFVSELGFIGTSEFAWLFNSGLFVGGLILIIFMWGLGGIIESKLAKTASIIGMIAGLFASLVGIFTMNNVNPHITVALGFFFCGMLSILLFSIAMYQDKHELFPRAFSMVGFVIFVCFIIFLFNPFDTSAINFADSFTAENIAKLESIRPEIWTIAILEWLSVLSVTFWIILISIFIKIKVIELQMIP